MHGARTHMGNSTLPSLSKTSTAWQTARPRTDLRTFGVPTYPRTPTVPHLAAMTNVKNCQIFRIFPRLVFGCIHDDFCNWSTKIQRFSRSACSLWFHSRICHFRKHNAQFCKNSPMDAEFRRITSSNFRALQNFRHGFDNNNANLKCSGILKNLLIFRREFPEHRGKIWFKK